MPDEIKQQEQQYLDHVITEIDREKTALNQKIVKTQADVKDIHKNFTNDVRIKTQSYSGMMEMAMSIRQQQQMLFERESREQQAEKRMQTLTRLEENPYFARIDFEEGDSGKPETIYIGMASFTDRPDHYLVYDWRAPISSIYYNGGIGKVTYQTPDGSQSVEVSLKRQFQIENQTIKTVFDTEEVVGDQMLLDALSHQSDTKMKSIVTTIQKEQNKIIRDTSSDLLFVQGAAGSGKTAAVLQRIAYLLYQYRGNLNSGQIILFSPNQIFNDYVNQVLPEMGEQNMVQMTFYQYSSHRLPKIKLETLAQRFDSQFNPLVDKMNTLKGSLPFFKAVSAYAHHLNVEDMRFKNIVFNGEVMISRQRIKEIYYQFNENYNLRTRLAATREALIKILNHKITVEMKKDWVEEAVENLTKADIQRMHNNYEEEIHDSDKEYKFLARSIVMDAFKKVQRQIVRNRFLAVNNQFVHLLRSIPQIIAVEDFGLTAAEWQAGIEMTVDNLKAGELSLADSTTYIYLHDLITGKYGDKEIKYLFIDEVQDYSAFQLAFLKYSFPRAKFTLLGDLNQSILTHNDNHQLLTELETLFSNGEINVAQLTKSYRSTMQITEFTKDLLVNGEAIESFSRSGELPHVYVKDSAAAMVAQAVTQIEQNNQDGYTTAIIGKTLAESEQLTEQLRECGVKVTLIKTENQRLAKGVIVVPSYLAKGLEFDSVIMWDASDAAYHNESERQLVYTIATRAMHRLTIIAQGSLSRLFDRVPKAVYELN